MQNIQSMLDGIRVSRTKKSNIINNFQSELSENDYIAGTSFHKMHGNPKQVDNKTGGEPPPMFMKVYTKWSS